MNVIRVVDIYSIVTSLAWLFIFIYIYLKIGRKDKYLVYYIKGIIVFIIFLSLGFIFKELAIQESTLIGILFLNISYILLILSIELFITIKGRKIWLWVSIAIIGVIIFTKIINRDYTIILNIYIGVLLSYIGFRLLKSKKNYNLLIGSFLILWGIFNLLCPVLYKLYDFDMTLYVINRIFIIFSEALFIIAYIYKMNMDYKYDNENIKNIFNVSSVGLELYNAKAELIIINPICLEMFEIENYDTVIGSNLFDRFNIANRSLEQLKSGKDVSFRVEFELNHDNKENQINNNIMQKKFLEVKINILGIDKLQPEGYFVQIEDISEQIYSSDKLEKRMKMAVSSANLYEWDWDIGNNLFYVDPIFAISLGYDGEKFNDKGTVFLNLIKEEDLEIINKELQKHFENIEQVFICEWRIKDATGNYKWYMGTGSVIERDEDGLPLRMVGINQCIERRKQSELELYNSEKRYRSLFETMVNGYARLEIKYGNDNNICDYKCIETNNSLNTILGLDEIQGKKVKDIITHEKYWIALINDMLKKMNQSRIEQYSRRLGKILEVIMHRFGNNQIILIIRDVTNERNLENMVRQTEKLSAIGQLVGGIAHDFNNQLMAISGAVSIIKTKYAGRECMKYIDYIEKCANNSASLVNRLLTFSRESDYKLIPIDLHSIINSVVEILERSIDKLIRIETSLEAENHMILGDESQIQNTLLNIGINARDALINGGQLVFKTYNITEWDCEKADVQEQKPAIVIIVSDTGIGMSEEVKKHLFEPFYTTKDIGKGTGMGLAMAFGVIKNHGGCISVNSVINVGTDFTIELPILDEKEYTPVDEDERLIKGVEKILVVDDEEIIRDLLQEMIEMLGYEVITYGDGFEALRYYKKHISDINLVLLDVVMPNISGKELVNEFYGINEDVRVGFLSGFGFEKMDKVITDRIVGFINKPINIEELSLKIREMLDHKRIEE
ncbi:response regulator [Vallitalea sp.]|jgi:signal transduction histidine kinase/CheY-like chemotaxis protein|uniref:response regulator n=1 Tax=Vallitalea sp. TaxID=1882829 RepID=UPI0025D31FB3|nr:response regulator [Vallitalea sp.]MCT4688541.1 response regulator [Vallitalea sp.]